MDDLTDPSTKLPFSVEQPDRFLTQSELATRWQVSMRTVEGWRLRGVGPIYVRIEGRVRYRQADITAYEAAGRRAKSLRQIPPWHP